MEQVELNNVLSLKEVCLVTGLHRTTIHRAYTKFKTLPCPTLLNGNTPVWNADDIRKFIAARVARKAVGAEMSRAKAKAMRSTDPLVIIPRFANASN